MSDETVKLKLSRKEFENIKAISGHVIFKPERENDEIIFKESGIRLFLDTRFEKEKHTQVVGEVVSVGKSQRVKHGEWISENDIRVGDRCWVSYLSVQNALVCQGGMAIDVEGETYIAIHENSVFLITRGDQVVMQNDYVLVEPVEKQDDVTDRLKKIGMIALNQDEDDQRLGIVRHVNNRPIKYIYKKKKQVDVSPGDKVMFMNVSDIPLEYDLHARFDNGKKYFRMQSYQLLVVVDQG